MPEVRHYCPRVPVVLVGNKKDLRHCEITKRELAMLKQEPVKTEEGKAVSKMIGAFNYVECSAKTREGVPVVFKEAARAIIHRQKKEMTCSML